MQDPLERSVQLAFVVRVRRRRIDSWRPLASTPSVAAAGFVVSHHLTWTSHDATIHLDVWLGDDAHDLASKWSSDGDIALMTGHRRTHDGRYEFTGATRDRPTNCGDGRAGVYAALALSSSGTGAAWNDPVGFRCLYVSDEADEFVVGSRAALVAAARDQPVTRDTSHAAWLAWLARWVGDATGFEGVRTLAPGIAVHIGNGVVSQTEGPMPWTPTVELDGLDVGQLADVAIDDAMAALVAATKTVERPTLRLTGGRDSRVLLGLAIAAGIEHDFDYLTVGPPNLADVEIAAELCARFGLDHRTEFLGLAGGLPFAEQATEFVQLVGGMVSIFEARPARPANHTLTVTGVCGEMLRASMPTRHAMATHADLLRHFGKDRFNRSGLVDRDVFGALHDELLVSLDAHGTAGLAPLDLLQRHAVTTSMRLVRLGPNAEVPGPRTVQPLNSFRAAQAAHALGGERRQGEVLIAEILRKTAPGLIDIRFAGPTWSPLAEEHLRSKGHAVRVEPPPAPSQPPTSPPSTSPASTTRPTVSPAVEKSLMQQLSQAGGPRVSFLREVAADRSSRAWEVLDRDAMTTALDHFGDLSAVERRNVFGAATAVLWLADEG